MNVYIKAVISLTILTLIVAFGLAYTNSLTSPLIEKNNKMVFEEKLKEMFPGMDNVTEVNGHYEIYGSGNLLGYAKISYALGYSSTIEILTGVKDSKIIGVEIISQTETPGLGTKITQKEFLNQFIGKDDADLKLTKFGGKIDGITSATISSKAVTDSVRTTVEELK